MDRDARIFSAVATVLIVAIIYGWFWWLAAICMVVTGAWTMTQSWTERRRVAAEIRTRADRQHRQVLAGDERGIFGDYPPVMS